ncbi:molybdopterin dinucleotide binding domain-containing protein, partial [Micrococcus sp. SIMBA_131]
DRCTLWLNPSDGERLKIQDGDVAVVESEVGRLEVIVELTNDIMPGVGSIPHGYGHGLSGVKMAVAKDNKGVNTNLLSDEKRHDAVSGTAVLNGIPITVSKTKSGREKHGTVRTESI